MRMDTKYGSSRSETLFFDQLTKTIVKEVDGMKIVHLCLACFFPDNYSYQENVLPKFHKALGHEVEVIASLQSFDKNGKVCYLSYMEPYINENDLLVTRLDYKKPIGFNRKMKRFDGLKEALEKAKPDVLFIHGCQFLDINIVVNYLKTHRIIKVYVDNHADFSNSATNWISLNILHKVIWKHCAHRILPYTEKFYGVLPARVDFLKNIYKLPENKIELLVMGAEDDKVEEAMNLSVRKELRKKYGIEEEDFLVVTGGKIDKAKQQILLLMEAIQKLNVNSIKVKLIVFGSVIPEMRDVVEASQSTNVKYIGWVNSAETYKYFGMANLVCFPGRHSVFWEQVAGMGIPMLVKYWNGTTHVDMDGNVEFLYQDSVQEIQEKLQKMIENYSAMKQIAVEKRREFLYSGIAEKSLR